MSFLGIDYQKTFTIMALRETAEGRRRVRFITDGARHVIPNCVTEDAEWGSSALARIGPAAIWEEFDRREHLWLEGAGPELFWRGIYKRLYSYLGRNAPLYANGYEIFVAIQSDDESTAVPRIQALSAKAGFDRIRIVRATDAVLCNWLSEAVPAENMELTVAVVATGDVLTQVAAYRVKCPMGVPIAACRGKTPLAAGHADWNRRVLDMVRDRLRTSGTDMPAGYHLPLNDAVVLFAAELGRASPSELVEWTGPFQNHMYSRPRLSLTQCELWPSVRLLKEELPGAIREAVREISGRERPDLIVLGGMGAAWPFVESIAASLGATWRSHQSTCAIADGAASIPAQGLRDLELTPGLLTGEGLAPSSRTTASPQVATVSPQAPGGLDLPPWKRRIR